MLNPRRLILSLVILCLFASPALADACDTLMSSIQQSLANPNLDEVSRLRLQNLQGAGRAAKAQGNIAACQSALEGVLQSRPPGRGSDCQKSPETV